MSGLAPGWDAAPEGSQGGVGGAGVGEVLTPAENSLLKTLALRSSAGGPDSSSSSSSAVLAGAGAGAGGDKGGVAGVEGLDRLMRVMINAPDVSCSRNKHDGSRFRCCADLVSFCLVFLLSRLVSSRYPSPLPPSARLRRLTQSGMHAQQCRAKCGGPGPVRSHRFPLPPLLYRLVCCACACICPR